MPPFEAIIGFIVMILIVFCGILQYKCDNYMRDRMVKRTRAKFMIWNILRKNKNYEE